jgi:hypothetical protein
MAFFSKDEHDKIQPREEQMFDWSVLWADEPQGSFSLPIIIVIVIQAVTLILLFTKK